MLGSSLFGARVAAAFGLPFSFASHFAPTHLTEALAIYRERFEPSEQLAHPYVMLGVNVVAADSDAEARFLASSGRQAFAMLAKSALVDMTREQAESWAGRGIRFNAVAPETALGDSGMRLTGEADIASLALYLASNKAKALSGCVFEAA